MGKTGHGPEGFSHRYRVLFLQKVKERKRQNKYNELGATVQAE